jgi:hypothetical protein
MSNVTHFRPQRAPAIDEEDAGAFTEDQTEVLGVALAGLKDGLEEGFDVRLVELKDKLEAGFEARLAAAMSDMRAELTQQLDAARSAAKDDLRSEFEQRLERTITLFRELTVAAIRGEILSKIDTMNFGTVDPRALERAIGELKVETAARIEGLASSLEARAPELDRLRREVKLLQSRLNRRINELVKGARIDAANYRATLVLADGSAGPAHDLKPLFQQFFDDVMGSRR